MYPAMAMTVTVAMDEAVDSHGAVGFSSASNYFRYIVLMALSEWDGEWPK